MNSSLNLKLGLSPSKKMPGSKIRTNEEAFGWCRVKCLLTDESANTSTIACSVCLFSENYGDHNVYIFYQSTLKIKDVSPILN